MSLEISKGIRASAPVLSIMFSSVFFFFSFLFYLLDPRNKCGILPFEIRNAGKILKQVQDDKYYRHPGLVPGSYF